MDQRRVGKPVTSLHHFLRCVLAGLCLITLALPAAEADEPAERLGAPEPAADANATPPGGQRRELVVNTSESVLVDAYGRLHQPDGTPAPASIVRNKHGDLVDLTHCTVYPGREEKELAYHRRRVGERQRQPTLRSTDAASLDALTAPSTTVTSSVFSYDVGDIAVLVDDGTLISGGSIDQVQAAIEFYRTHPDTFDFLMFFPNLDHTEGSFHSIVRNDTLGIGRTVMDNSLLYGSNHVLQSVTNYVNYATFPADPRARIPGNNDSSLSLIAQEAGHRWAAFAKFDTDPGPGVNSSSALLGRQGAHWCFFHHTESVGPANGASSLEGNTWSGTGPWTSTELTDGYSPLDLYLMGLREAAAVPPLFYIANPTGTSATCSATPTTGVTIDGTQTTVTMQQVLEAMGPRVPDAANAQRTYRQAFVLLAQSVPSQADIDKLEAIRSAWVSYFSVETLGLGIVDTSLGTPPPGPVAGFRLVLPTRPAINIPTRVSVVAVDANGTLVPSYTGTVQVATTDRFATLPPTVTIAPAATGIGSFAVTFRVAGAQELQVSDMSNGTWQGSATVDVAPVHFPVARRLTTEAHTQAAPAISGNLIVWEDQRNLNADIYLYDLGTGTERPLTTTLGDQRNPAIDGDGVVWEDASRVFYYDLATETGDRVVTRLAQPQRNPAISGDRIVWEEGQSADDIYLYDLTTNTETRLTIDIWAQRNPAISGNFVVWEDDRNGNTDIYLYDLTSNTQRQLTSHPAAQRNPAISGNFVVWEDDRNGNTDIYLYDLTSNTEMRLTADPAAQRNPAISGDFVVWKDERGAFPVIYWHDLTSGAEQPLAPAVSDQLAPAISDNQIVWQDSRAGNWEIYLGYAGGLTAIPVVTNPAGQGDPAISGNRIVWQDYRNGNADIYLYDLTTGTEMPITSDPAVDQAMPAISGNRIVWQDYRNGNADIYLYDLASGS
ncbi:MAG: hypothetical protein HY597_03770, partial [Candidatus Omnitrophica bacterium]|nr:hypothetical protein [Candidatus Omnitrophota bacterium]